MKTPPQSKPVAARHLSRRHRKGAKSPQASAITNGTVVLPDTDGRSRYSRRVKDLLRQHVSDLGGADNVSSAEMALVKRCAVLSTELEYREMAFAAQGHASDDKLIVYQTCVNSLRRTLESLGLRRRARPVQSLDQYLAERYPAEEAPFVESEEESTDD